MYVCPCIHSVHVLKPTYEGAISPFHVVDTHTHSHTRALSVLKDSDVMLLGINTGCRWGGLSFLCLSEWLKTRGE